MIPYQFLGKTQLNLQPVVDLLLSSIVPLFTNFEYRNHICELRSAESILTGSPPVFLDKEWQPEKQHLSSSKSYWCLPFKYDDNSAMFVVGGRAFLEAFPDIFLYNTVDPWYSKLRKFQEYPQIIITNGTSSKHIDLGSRSTAINTFMYNTDKSVTQFTKGNQNLGSIIYEPGDSYLIDVKTEHQIVQQTDDVRIVMSWGYKCPFSDALDLLK